MIKEFVIADTHFSHKAIIEYTSRPFKDVLEMNETIIDNWNKVVGKYDKVFHLGDYCLGSRDDCINILRRLNGYKILVLGNHDRSINFYYDIGFNEVYKYPIYKDGCILSHKPVYENIFNIHGHVHNNILPHDTHFCVSVENTEYLPLEIRSVMKHLKKEV